VGTDRDTADKIIERLNDVSDARTRPMMGDYVVYVDDIVIGQINEGRLFIKDTDFAREHATELDRLAPYEGAKPAVAVPGSRLDDPQWLHTMIQGTLDALGPRKAPARRDRRPDS
jgi:TfoX/Sxy family transcriptional regulator of competence genes